jgi:hypothetical protein
VDERKALALEAAIDALPRDASAIAIRDIIASASRLTSPQAARILALLAHKLNDWRR